MGDFGAGDCSMTLSQKSVTFWSSCPGPYTWASWMASGRSISGPWAGFGRVSATSLAGTGLKGLYGPLNPSPERAENGSSEQLFVKTVFAAYLGGEFEEISTMRSLDATAVTVNVNHLVRKDGHQAVGATDVPGRKPDNVPILRRPAVATGPF